MIASCPLALVCIVVVLATTRQVSVSAQASAPTQKPTSAPTYTLQQQDANTLCQFKENTDSFPKTDDDPSFVGWQCTNTGIATTQPCPGNSWTGVSCSSTDNRVIGLNLPNFNLKGSAASAINTLSTLPLQTLWLPSNALKGTLPNTISTMIGLYNMSLNQNQLTGALPINSLPMDIVYVDLSNNQFKNNLPSLQVNHKKLNYLNLANNGLKGSLPVINSSSLQILNLEKK